MPTCPECGSEDLDLFLSGWACCECGASVDEEDILAALSDW